jgi:hypothetical protein
MSLLLLLLPTPCESGFNHGLLISTYGPVRGWVLRFYNTTAPHFANLGAGYVSGIHEYFTPSG